MFKFKALKILDRTVDLEQDSISSEELNKLLQLLNNKVVQDFALTFQFENDTENLDGNLAQSGQKNFFELVKARTSILLNEQFLNSRVINTVNQPDNVIIDYVKNLTLQVDPSLQTDLESKNQQKTALSAQLSESLTDEQKQKFNRLEEVNSRVKTVQEQVDFYQNEKKLKEGINTEIKKLNTDKETISQMLKSVELIIANKQELQKKIDDFNTNQNVPSSDQIKELRNKKLQFLNSNLLSNKSLKTSKVEDNQIKVKSFNLNPALVLTIINIFITIIGFLYSYNFSVLLSGIIFSIILSFLYIASRFYTDALEGLSANESDLSLNAQLNAAQNSPAEAAKSAADPNTNLFINSALLNALKSEIELLDVNIQKNLNGKSYEALQSDLQNIDVSLNAKNIELEELNSKSLTSDEYYKKRREVDILKIEKENLEFGLKANPESIQQMSILDEQIKELTVKIEMATQISESFPVFLIGALTPESRNAIKAAVANQIIWVNP